MSKSSRKEVRITQQVAESISTFVSLLCKPMLEAACVSITNRSAVQSPIALGLVASHKLRNAALAVLQGLQIDVGDGSLVKLVTRFDEHLQLSRLHVDFWIGGKIIPLEMTVRNFMWSVAYDHLYGKSHVRSDPLFKHDVINCLSASHMTFELHE